MNGLDRLLGVNPYRQVAVALARWDLMADLLLDQDSNILDLQASHGSAVANRHYGIELGSYGEIPSDVAYKFENTPEIFKFRTCHASKV